MIDRSGGRPRTRVVQAWCVVRAWRWRQGWDGTPTAASCTYCSTSWPAGTSQSGAHCPARARAAGEPRMPAGARLQVGEDKLRPAYAQGAQPCRRACSAQRLWRARHCARIGGQRRLDAAGAPLCRGWRFLRGCARADDGRRRPCEYLGSRHARTARAVINVLYARTGRAV